jgi:hypothetical protein
MRRVSSPITTATETPATNSWARWAVARESRVAARASLSFSWPWSVEEGKGVRRERERKKRMKVAGRRDVMEGSSIVGRRLGLPCARGVRMLQWMP